jgi:hypothetical protein
MKSRSRKQLLLLLVQTLAVIDAYQLPAEQGAAPDANSSLIAEMTNSWYTLALFSPKTAYTVSENVAFFAVLSNAGPNSVQFAMDSSAYTLEVTLPSGERCPPTAYGKTLFENAGDFWHRRFVSFPAHTAVTNVFAELNRLFEMKVPGTYKVQAGRTMPSQISPKQYLKVRSAILEITLKKE